MRVRISLLIAALLLAAEGPDDSAARIHAARPHPCAPPADAPRVISFHELEDGESVEFFVRSDVIVLYPVIDRGWASRRILMRFDLVGAGPPQAEATIRCRAVDQPKRFYLK